MTTSRVAYRARLAFFFASGEISSRDISWREGDRQSHGRDFRRAAESCDNRRHFRGQNVSHPAIHAGHFPRELS